MNDVDRFADSLVDRRTPAAFRPDDEQVAQMRAAIELRAGALADAIPSTDFVERLQRSLADSLGARRHTRRRVVQTAGIAAASLAAGVGVDRLVSSTPGPVGTWQPLLASADLQVGDVHEFELDTLSGFVRRTPDGVEAVSSICTHLGCKLRLAAQQLRCPCHDAVFALTGEVVHYDLPIDLPPLPRIEARERDGMVELLTPPKKT